MSKFDVAIVGGGVIGLSAALELAAEKLRVVVFDRQQPGQEASWAAAGMLSPAPDSPRDLHLVPLSRESLKIYPDFVAAVEERSGKSAGYAREGALTVFLSPRGQAERDHLISEHRELGLAAEAIGIETIRQSEPSITQSAQAIAWHPDEGSVDPRALMDTLLATAQSRGVEIRADCPVEKLLFDQTKCIGVSVAGDKIHVATVMLAAGCYSAQLADGTPLLACTPTRPVRGQMLALRPDRPSICRVVRSEHCYLVPRNNGCIAVGSTLEDAGFEKRVTPSGIGHLLNSAVELCPDLARAELVETWSGLRPGTPDDLPILGPAGCDGLLIATGHYRNGILLAPITARLVRDWIVRGQPSFDVSAFSPLRFADTESKAHSAV